MPSIFVAVAYFGLCNFYYCCFVFYMHIYCLGIAFIYYYYIDLCVVNFVFCFVLFFHMKQQRREQKKNLNWLSIKCIYNWKSTLRLILAVYSEWSLMRKSFVIRLHSYCLTDLLLLLLFSIFFLLFFNFMIARRLVI